MSTKAIEQWHRIVTTGDVSALNELLHDDAVFHSPVVHTPQVGKPLVHAYLTAAIAVLGNSSFRYVRELVSEREAVLEFMAELDGITINGVDMIAWDENDRIIDFKVMIRPLKAVSLIHQKMGEMLQGTQ